MLLSCTRTSLFTTVRDAGPALCTSEFLIWSMTPFLGALCCEKWEARDFINGRSIACNACESDTRLPFSILKPPRQCRAIGL